MSTEFAERIIDGMVDEDGHCGERGLSEKQFLALARHLKPMGTRDAGGWKGHSTSMGFTTEDYEGNIGRYRVKLNEYQHFHGRYTVVAIDLRPQAEIDVEDRLRELARFEGSEHVGKVKERRDMELTLVRDHPYERYKYRSGYYTETAHIYTLADDDGNCYVWKTTALLSARGADGDETAAEPGDRVALRATVKAHDEYRGVRQTVLTRAQVKRVGKARDEKEA